MSETLRDLIKMDIEAYEEGLEIKEDKESKSVSLIPEIKVSRVSYDDGKTWIDVSSENK